jgi:hypothetical protein
VALFQQQIPSKKNQYGNRHMFLEGKLIFSCWQDITAGFAVDRKEIF